MNTVDIVLIVLLALFFMNGWRKGFVVTLGQLIGAVIGFWVARAWSGWLADILAKYIHMNPGLLHFIVFIIIFLIIDRLLGLLLGLVAYLLKIVTVLPLVSTINRLLGALLGLAEGLVLVGSSVYLILSLHLHPTLIDWASHSTVARYTEHIFYVSLGYLL